MQILLNRFRIQGIIHFGSAGSLDEKSIVPGDVSVPLAVAFTGAWNWKVITHTHTHTHSVNINGEYIIFGSGIYHGVFSMKKKYISTLYIYIWMT